MLKITAGQKRVGFIRWIFKAALLLVISSLKHNLNLADAQYLTGPTSMAIGGAGVTGLKSPESVFLNPAALSEQGALAVDLIYQDGVVQKDERKTLTGLLIVDNSEEVMIPGALTYARGSRRFAGVLAEEQMWMVAFGKEVYERWSLGIGLSYLTSEIESDKTYKQLVAQLGTQVRVTENIAFGLVFENLGGDDKELPLAFRLIPQTRAGFSYRPQDLFAVALEVSRRERENEEKKGAVHFGLESFPNAFTVVRTGMKWDDYAQQNFYTFGLGFDGPRLKMNYALQKAMKGTNGALHGVDFQVAF